MDWDAISFDSWAPLVVIRGTLTAKRLSTLLLPARSPDLLAIKHVWDMMGRQLYIPRNIDDLVRQLSKFGKKYRRRPSGCLVSLCHVVGSFRPD
ncbi:hypothetical protein TNCV_441661 [Trichonephila clavipes]|nr:hypothetical protein TNCV_441661 [Trichonephila clavipes]